MRNKIIILAVLLMISVTSAATQVQLETKTSPTTIMPGNDGYVELKITNGGTTSLESIKVMSLKIDSPLALKTASYLENLGSLGAGKAMTTIYKFNVPSSASSGFYTMEFLIEACTSSVCDSYVQNALISVQSPTLLGIKSVDPTSFKAGENTTITFILKNSGKTLINNVKFSWEDTSNTIIPLGADNKKFISSISDETQIPVNIIVNPSAKPGTYSLSIKIEYDDQTGTKQSINSTVGLRVVGDFNFIVSLESQDLVASGMSGKTDIKIANAGTQEAYFLTINILDSDPITQIKPKVIYAGNIESDDYDTETIEFKVTDAIPGEYPLNLEISCKDLYGNLYSERYALDIVVSSKEDVAAKKSDSSWMFYLVIIFIVGFLLYRKIIKKKR